MEHVLALVAFRDMDPADLRTLPPSAFIQALRLAKLTVEYLLHVQDRLADETPRSRCGACQC